MASSKKVKVGINGFGRIGRNLLRAAIKYDMNIDFVAVNDLTNADMLAHLLKYDSVHGIMDADVSVDGNNLVVNGDSVQVLSHRDPAQLPWKDLGADIVIESTGLFTDRDSAMMHLNAGAKKVLISAPAKGEDLTIVLGVNDHIYDPAKHHIISNASCTTNCLAPVAKILHENFTIETGIMTTIHAYTNDQRILDLPHKDKRRARAAALSMIPTSTGAAQAVGKVLPELNGKLTGMAVRCPTPNVSVVDLSAVLGSTPSKEEVNAALRNGAAKMSKKVLVVCDDLLVSSDFNGNPASSIVDSDSTLVLGNMVKVLSWYDNEWGYSVRIAELAQMVGESL